MSLGEFNVREYGVRVELLSPIIYGVRGFGVQPHNERQRIQTSREQKNQRVEMDEGDELAEEKESECTR
jgi:hypothetical protein